MKDSNWNWRDFGWNDRADWFYNQGATHNAIIYEHAGYAGASRFLVRGATTYWYNTVSSNSWVR